MSEKCICGATGFPASVIPGRCQYCDGTFGGNPPKVAEVPLRAGQVWTHVNFAHAVRIVAVAGRIGSDSEVRLVAAPRSCALPLSIVSAYDLDEYICEMEMIPPESTTVDKKQLIYKLREIGVDMQEEGSAATEDVSLVDCIADFIDGKCSWDKKHAVFTYPKTDTEQTP